MELCDEKEKNLGGEKLYPGGLHCEPRGQSKGKNAAWAGCGAQDSGSLSRRYVQSLPAGTGKPWAELTKGSTISGWQELLKALGGA